MNLFVKYFHYLQNSDNPKINWTRINIQFFWVIHGRITCRPSHPQKWLNWVFGPKRCVMFWNVCRINYPISLYFFKVFSRFFTKNLILPWLHSNYVMPKFQKILKKNWELFYLVNCSLGSYDPKLFSVKSVKDHMILI